MTVRTATPLVDLAKWSHLAVSFDDTSDDIAPISVGSSYVGGNHGWNVVRLTAAAHGKTTADLGSTWSDGSRTYTLLRVVDPATLILSFAHTVDASGRVAVGGTLPQATLTHVAGATNTASLSIAGGRTFDQLRPSSHSRTVTINLCLLYTSDAADE